MRFVLYSTLHSMESGYMIFGCAATWQEVYEYLVQIRRSHNVLVLDKQTLALYNGTKFVEAHKEAYSDRQCSSC